MGPQEELQKVVRDALRAAPAVMALASDVYDRVPADAARWGGLDAYISFGPCDTVEDETDCVAAALHALQIDCWSRRPGLVWAKRMADAVAAALRGLDTGFVDNALVDLRVTGRRAFVDADGLTGHGIVTVEALIEEA
ncbi:DUF3168 domain-containing protein [Zavarzinia aquatilis]|uniref:DUF3168 domain-containing protein n=1 Tax=Zavarzinia aquatilis TaxID=2211142 RepID=A0A317EEM7_9PROT|nr:DUF3168 domain-containing protein [Zavarzinia aquatilis]PWR24570.1 DUF3168 domain-containing protein [Zavarzinia aquatilis]